jgi:hypothetical protein
MYKQLGILTIAVGLILVIASIAFYNIAEVRMWFPMTLIIASALAWWGIKRYREV